LLRNFIIYLGCGHVYKAQDSFSYRVQKFDELVEKIIPFFKNYPIHGVKVHDFEDFCKAADMMKAKEHLTKEGLDQIKKIKARMNKGRKSNSSHNKKRD